jgi:class 3 adenylate cyclase/tRNA A-37 threonylcarbamoyl transferase component Bud32
MTSGAGPAAFAAGRYLVRRVLGEGAEKRVYLAHDVALERDVAVAVLRTSGLDETRLARLRREARAMARLGDHAHIVTVYDFGEENGQIYIVSQHMAGGSVEDLLQRAEDRRLPMEDAVRLTTEVCRALDHAHRHGVIHRDVKPSNVWLTQEGTAKLGDFGLAAMLDLPRLTAEGVMVGTVVFMAPEQAMGRPPDARSDLYALGAMLYELVTGRPPFLGDNALAVISQHINTPPVAPSVYNPEISPALEALVLRLLGKVPEDRPESAAAVEQILAAISAGTAPRGARTSVREPNPLERLAGGTFVGRERELTELQAGVDDAISGRGRLLLLAGEPGIGKTRTAEELVTYARLRGARALWGRCYEGEGAPPYWPWVQIIRSYIQDRDTEILRADLGSGAVDVAQIVPEVRERFPQLPRVTPQEPEQARFRLFDTVSTFLKKIARAEPIVLVLDDLHSADKPSLLLLQFLASQLAGARLAIVGTYRDAEVGRRHPLSSMLGDVARQDVSRRIFLRGLTKADVARFIEVTANVKPPAALATAVYTETEGNPLFVGEVVRLLASEGYLERPDTVQSWRLDIPQSIRDVIRRRLDRLSPECNEILTTAAVMGREFGLDLLEQVSALAGDQLLDVLDEAAGARIIVEMPRLPGRYSFAHALIRETLYGEIRATARLRLHRQIGEAVEALHGTNPEAYLTELAYHFFEAALGGDGTVRSKAIDYSSRAGECATAQLAYEDAVTHYERALQALDRQSPAGDERRCELLLKLGEAHWGGGEIEKSREAFRSAAEAAEALGAASLLARAALGYGGQIPSFDWVDEAQVGLLERSFASFADEDSALAARVTGRLSAALAFSDAHERRTALARRAVEMARRVGDPAALADVLYTTYWATWALDNAEERLDVATELLGLAENASDSKLAASGHIWRLMAVLEMGNIDEAEREFDALARLANTRRRALRRGVAARLRSMRGLLEGRYDEVEGLVGQPLGASGERMAARFVRLERQATPVQLFLVFLRREQGRLDEVVEPVKALPEQVAKALPEHPSVMRAWRCWLAWIYAELGRHGEARRELAAVAGVDFAGIPRDPTWLSCLWPLCEVVALVGDADRAEKLYELLLPHAWRCVVLPGTLCMGSLSRSLGLLAATSSRFEDGARHFEDALAMNAAMRTRPWLAHTQHEYARMLVARGERGDCEKALALLAQALDTAQALGMKALLDQALALKLRAQGVAPTVTTSSIDAVASAVERERPDLRTHAAPDGTVTLLFTDIEGYTAMVERLGDRRAHEVLRAHNAVVRQQVAAHEGFEVKSAGDGFMIAFQSARRAVLCAIAIQRAIADHGARDPGIPLRVRIGLHTGEMIKEADDFFGKAVILTARITNEARGGEILVSALLKELVEGTGEFSFDGGREARLKGLAGVQRVFTLRW